ncbi:lytic polysaccharide monooxygenase [Karstenula rhodostoma CBS 690.94]|uniref:AA9 family lytic polysaccharide monooxygenase n=1 Tax=Karstenula rhodostoma CBS 690.94 TaxID=1392251 RepID=A0A9P4UGU4_9PLEO|nr:lytic polysaccharide monooxygenase [Karstenula rhodostoma CBS 690.94]
MFFQTSALIALAASASAHMILNSPIPFAFENEATRQAPLEPADFPCKQPAGTYSVTEMNTVAAGGSLDVQLMGGATHGGGSCQFSITTDTKPTKDSQWKVLHSQIHGCQGGPLDNNMSNNASDTNNPKIPVTIPEGLPAGQYTFAWTWLNKLGNREFYMNCAPLTVTSGSSKRDTASADVSSILGQLPDMFVANLPYTECAVAAGQDFVYPNPGDSVATGEGATPGTAISGTGCAAVTILGAGAGKLGSPAEATAAPTNGGGIFAPGASSAAGTAPASSAPAVTQAPVTSQPAASYQASQPAATSVASQPAAAQPSSPSAPDSGSETSSGSNNASSGAGAPCDSDGAVVCIGTDSFGLCNFGYAVAQKLADGMSCSNGQLSRRSIRFPRGTLHNRHAALHKRVSVL